MNAAFAKLIARELTSQSIRLKALENARRRNGEPPLQITMDDATRELFQKMMAALDEKIDAAPATQVSEEVATPAPAQVEKRKVVVETPEKPKARVVKPEAVTSDRKVNYDLWPIEKLKRVVIKRGGDPERIVRGLHARARNKALVNWLRKNKKAA